MDGLVQAVWAVWIFCIGRKRAVRLSWADICYFARSVSVPTRVISVLGQASLVGFRAAPVSTCRALQDGASYKPHAPGGGGRKWMLCSAASATTASGFCSFML